MWICPECRSIYREAVPRCERDRSPVAEVKAHQSKARYPLLGKIVGDRYHLIGGLGQGGLGTVYLAEHRHLGQLFAVKFLDLETLGVDMKREQKDETRTDFLKEARVASLIRHDSVVRVSDFGEHQRLPFLVMEYVPGPSLLQMLGHRGRFDLPEAINIARRIAEALDAFHERRLVHRDLKPANVILDPRGDGRLMLVDLGLVKDVSGPGGRASTHPMALRGTPGYLAPEQVPAWVLSGAGVLQPGEKQPVDARVDLYALGVIFYEMLAGVSPYPDGTNNQIIVYCCTRDAIPITSVQPPVRLMPGLAELIHDTMSRDPLKRPQSAAQFLDRLDQVALGAATQGSWPMVVLPDGPRATPTGQAAGAPSLGVLSIDIEAADDPDEETAVFDAIDDEDDEDSVVAHLGASGAVGVGTLERLATPSLPDNVHSAPAMASPAAVHPPSAPLKKSALPWVLVGLIALLGGAGGWYFVNQSQGSATPDAGTVTTVNVGRPVAAADASAPPVDAAPAVQVPDASPPVADAAVDAAIVADAAKANPPKAPATKTVRRRKPRRKPRVKTPPKPVVDAGVAVDPKLAQANALRRRGDRAYRIRQFAEALGHYEAYLLLVDETDSNYHIIKNRIAALKNK